MNIAAINFQATEEFIYPLSPNTLVWQLTTAKGDFTNIALLCWERSDSNMQVVEKFDFKLAYQDAVRDYWRLKVTFAKKARYLRYAFQLCRSDQTYRFGRYGLLSDRDELSEQFYEFLWPNPSDCLRSPAWAKDQIYYQIFPERFCNAVSELNPHDVLPWGSAPNRTNFMGGDLLGIIKKLPYLADLGITCLYLTPIFQSYSNHKYDTVDYYSIDKHFGDKSTLLELVRQAHALKIRVLLDGVFNHCGFHFPYFQDVVQNGANSKYVDWFFVHDFPVQVEPCNYDCVGNYKWMPKLNLALPEVQNYFIEVGLYYLREFGIDGWRLDVADELPTAFIANFTRVLKNKFPDCLLLGETWGNAKRIVGINRLDSAMNYLFKDAVTDWLAKSKIKVSTFDERINSMLSLYPDKMNLQMYNLLDSHDTERFLYSADGNVTKLRLAVALQMLLPGCPAIFYGDEIGVSGANDPACRQAMPWDISQQDLKTFNWYKQLISCRKMYEALCTGEFKTVYCSDADCSYAFRRNSDNQSLLCLLNASAKDCYIPLPIDRNDNAYLETTASALAGEVKLQINSRIHKNNQKNTGILLQKVPAYNMQIILLERKV